MKQKDVVFADFCLNLHPKDPRPTAFRHVERINVGARMASSGLLTHEF